MYIYIYTSSHHISLSLSPSLSLSRSFFLSFLPQLHSPHTKPDGARWTSPAFDRCRSNHKAECWQAPGLCRANHEPRLRKTHPSWKATWSRGTNTQLAGLCTIYREKTFSKAPNLPVDVVKTHLAVLPRRVHPKDERQSGTYLGHTWRIMKMCVQYVHTFCGIVC